MQDLKPPPVIMDIVDLFSTIWDYIKAIPGFLNSILSFLLKTGKLLFTYLGRVFSSIFSEDFFDGLITYFEEIYKYMGSSWGTIFVSLFILVFFLMVFGFIMRVLRGRVNYNATLKKLSKQESKK